MPNIDKVYRFVIDPDKYLYLNETGFEQTMQLTEGLLLNFDGSSMRDNWRTLGINWLIHESNKDLDLEIPDIAGLGATSFVLSQKAKTILEPYLGDNVEYLECDLNGELWFAMNVLGFEDAIEHELTEFNYNRRGQISRTRRFKRLVIDKNKISNLAIFRTKETTLRYFTTDAENSFYRLVKENNLTGLEFIEVEAK
ncbi:imm11 family protein [Pseudoalteromonas sp. 68 DY56-GL68]|uniref:imm11 family protein n=1 Tax=Pseudoalteromonas sp. 68 DY56-GL68 TaxID=2974919 RepID=UPI00352B40A6